MPNTLANHPALTALLQFAADNGLTVHADAATAELARLFNKLDKHEEIARELELLTPGGSEYHNDPDRCLETIKQRLEFTERRDAQRNAITPISPRKP